MNLELLRQVCVTPGAPGFEDKIRDFIIQEVAPLVDAVRVDNMDQSYWQQRFNGARRVLSSALDTTTLSVNRSTASNDR